MFNTVNKAAPKHSTGATVCTPDWSAMSQRVARLKRELKVNKQLIGIR